MVKSTLAAPSLPPASAAVQEVKRESRKVSSAPTAASSISASTCYLPHSKIEPPRTLPRQMRPPLLGASPRSPSSPPSYSPPPPPLSSPPHDNQSSPMADRVESAAVSTDIQFSPSQYKPTIFTSDTENTPAEHATCVISKGVDGGGCEYGICESSYLIIEQPGSKQAIEKVL